MTLQAAWAASAVLTLIAPSAAAQGDLAPIPAGLYTPFQRAKAANAGEPAAAKPKAVAAFSLDVEPVTNADFLAFVTGHPQWRKSRIKALFADRRYLRAGPPTSNALTQPSATSL